MSEENKTFELNDEELEKVNGGGSGTYNGVVYKDGDVYVTYAEDLSSTLIYVYVLKNCATTTCDIDNYYYNQRTKEFIYLNLYLTNFKYSNFSDNYIKLQGVTLNN